jgi:hypothetical protein
MPFSPCAPFSTSMQGNGTHQAVKVTTESFCHLYQEGRWKALLHPGPPSPQHHYAKELVSTLFN